MQWRVELRILCHPPYQAPMSPPQKSNPGRMTARIVDFAVTRAWLTILVAALLTAALAGYTAAYIGIETDTSNMLDPDLPHRKAHWAYRKAFPALPGGVVIFTEAAHAGDAEDTADALAVALRARPDIALSVERPGADDFFATHGLLYLDTEALWALDQRLAEAAPMLGTLALDPSLRGLFTTLNAGLAGTPGDIEQVQLGNLFARLADAIDAELGGRPAAIRWRDDLFQRPGVAPGVARAFVLIDPALTEGALQPVNEALDGLRRVVADIATRHPEVQIRITGANAMDSEELATVAADATLTTTLSFLLVGAVLIWGLRSGSLVLAVLLTLACGLVWTAAFATFLVGKLNIISVCFAVLFIGMGVDFGIQFAMRYREELARQPEQRVALTQAAVGVGGALLLATVGAAISFFAFVPTHYLGLAELGKISGISMAIAWFANVTVLPALLSRLPRPHPLAPEADPSRGATPWVNRHYRAILGVTLALVIGCLWTLPRAEFDLNPLNLKDPRTDAVRAFRALAEDPASTPYTIHVLAESRAAATALAARLDALDEVDKVVTLDSYVPDDQDEKLEIVDGMRLSLGALLDPQPIAPATAAEELQALSAFQASLRSALPRLSQEAARVSGERLLDALDELARAPGWPDVALPALRADLLGDLPQTLTRLARLLEAEEVTPENLPPDLAASYVAADGQVRLEVFPTSNLSDNDAMRRFVRAVQSVAPSATDGPVELVEGSNAVITACIQASLWALLLTLVMHIFVLHGVLDALLVAAPLALAMLFTVATSVLFDVPFNFANIIALPLLIGLNNAYGAYLVIRKHSANDIGALLHSSTPRAVLFSGLAAIASFGVLAVSAHPGMAGMGVLISVSLSYALLSALLVLPAAMAALEAHERSARPAP